MRNTNQIATLSPIIRQNAAGGVIPRTKVKSQITSDHRADQYAKYPLVLAPIPREHQQLAATSTSRKDYLSMVMTILAAENKCQDYDRYMPRQSRIDSISAELYDPGTTSPPEGFSGKTAETRKNQWKYDVAHGYKSLLTSPDIAAFIEPNQIVATHSLQNDKVYEWGPKQVSALESWNQARLSGKTQPGPIFSPMTGAEQSYNIILASHINVNGKHLGRDTTYKAVAKLTTCITKELVSDFCARCPGCKTRRTQAQGGHAKRNNFQAPLEESIPFNDTYLPRDDRLDGEYPRQNFGYQGLAMQPSEDEMARFLMVYKDDKYGYDYYYNNYKDIFYRVYGKSVEDGFTGEATVVDNSRHNSRHIDNGGYFDNTRNGNGNGHDTDMLRSLYAWNQNQDYLAGEDVQAPAYVTDRELELNSCLEPSFAAASTVPRTVELKTEWPELLTWPDDSPNSDPYAHADNFGGVLPDITDNSNYTQSYSQYLDESMDASFDEIFKVRPEEETRANLADAINWGLLAT